MNPPTSLTPYIGICDFTSGDQVTRMQKILYEARRPGSTRRLHVGVMMSYKTLNGIETKWSAAFPPKESIPRIFHSDETYNCLHFVDYDEQPDLAKTIEKALFHSGYATDALQLDMVWPDPVAISTGIHMSRKMPEVILQIGSRALDAAGNDPDVVVSYLEDYEGHIHRVLLDRSMGKGVPLSPDVLLPYLRHIRAQFPKLGLVVAGGLGPETLHLLEPIVAEFPDVSIDAQSRLRPSGNAMDPIDWSMAGDYLAKALTMLE